MFIPISDDNPRYSTAVVNYLLIAANVIVYLLCVTSGNYDGIIEKWGMYPATMAREPLTIFTSMFLHAGFLHLAGNMLFLWIVGDNIEDALGHLFYLVAYLGGGLAADILYAAFAPAKAAMVPTVGASGAISAIMGFYVVIFPQVRIRMLYIWFFIGTLWARAFWVIGAWFVLQLAYWGLTQGGQGGVAYAAHVGGFIFGAGLAFALKRVLPQIDPHVRHGCARPAGRVVSATARPVADADVPIILGGDWRRGQPLHGGTVEVELVGSAENMEHLIERRLLEGDVAGAQRVYNGYVRVYPHRPISPMLQLNLVQGLERVGNHVAAAGCLEHFLGTHPSDANVPEAKLALGLIYSRHLGHIDRARLMLGAAAVQHPVPARAALARQELAALR